MARAGAVINRCLFTFDKGAVWRGGSQTGRPVECPWLGHCGGQCPEGPRDPSLCGPPMWVRDGPESPGWLCRGERGGCCGPAWLGVGLLPAARSSRLREEGVWAFRKGCWPFVGQGSILALGGGCVPCFWERIQSSLVLGFPIHSGQGAGGPPGDAEPPHISPWGPSVTLLSGPMSRWPYVGVVPRHRCLMGGSTECQAGFSHAY